MTWITTAQDSMLTNQEIARSKLHFGMNLSYCVAQGVIQRTSHHLVSNDCRKATFLHIFLKKLQNFSVCVLGTYL